MITETATILMLKYGEDVTLCMKENIQDLEHFANYLERKGWNYFSYIKHSKFYSEEQACIRYNRARLKVRAHHEIIGEYIELCQTE